MVTKPKRKDLLQDFFETLTAMHRLIGASNSLSRNKDRRAKPERRQPQVELLYLLDKKKELTIKKIAAAMHITSSAATQMVENMVSQGVVERKDDPRDRRLVKVILTAKGKAQFQKFKKAHLDRIAAVMKPLSDEELRTLVSIRKKVLGDI